MTTAQTKRYWALWRDACKAQGWTVKAGWNTAQIEEQRYQMHREVLGVESSKDIDEHDGFTKIKEYLLDKANRINNNAAIDNPRRTSLWKIRNELLPCLALYEDVDAYLKPILTTRFKLPPGCGSIEDLSVQPRIDEAGEEKASPMEMLKFTLSARINTKRKEAGDTGHQMCAKARVRCGCKQCNWRVPALPRNEPVHNDQPAEELVGAESNNPF